MTHIAPGLPAERPVLAVDLVLLTIAAGRLQCLLIRRKAEPFAGGWALPGGFVRAMESLEEAAFRELAEEAGVRDVYLEQLYTLGDPRRDPRGRVVSVAYYALIDAARQELRASTDASDARWFPLSELPALAFDHGRILELALERLRAKANYTTVAFQLLPGPFTLDELRKAYEVLLGQALDRRNFRKKMLSLNILRDTGKTASHGGRPGRLYRLRRPGLVKLQERGILSPF